MKNALKALGAKHPSAYEEFVRNLQPPGDAQTDEQEVMLHMSDEEISASEEPIRAEHLTGLPMVFKYHPPHSFS